MIFTREESNQITRALFYPEFQRGDEYVYSILQGIIDRERKELILELIEQVEEIKLALSKAISKSFLEQVDEIKLNYRVQIRELKREGSRLLKQIAQLTGLELKYNPFISDNNIFFRSLP